MLNEGLPPLSRAETEILRIVWQLGRASVRQVCYELPAERKITYATVQTLLRRLERKGYLSHLRRGKTYVFFEAVSRKQVIKREVADFVDRLFGGDAASLMYYLAEHIGTSPKDIRRLKQILEGKS